MRRTYVLTRVTCRLLLQLLAIMTIPVFGCSRAPEDPAWFQSTETGEALNDESMINRVRSVSDPITIYRMREDYRRRGGNSAAVTAALDQHLEQVITAQTPLGSPCPEVDLVAFDYRKVGPAGFRADYLFRVNQPFENDLKIGLYGTVTPEHLDRISDQRKAAGKKSEFWRLTPSPPTSIWMAGDVILLSQYIRSAPIPYNLSMIFYDPSREPGQHGEAVQLGWRQGVTEEMLINSIEEAANLIDLYRLEGDCANLPAAREAFRKKAETLRTQSESLGAICEEADLWAFDYRFIGDNRYRVDYLFRVKRPLEHDCLITLYGVVDENHRDFLSEERRRQGKRSEEWTFRPDPPTTEWPAGQCVLISSKIEAAPIPYKMHTILYDRVVRRQHGDQVALGWRADPREEHPVVE